MSMEAVSACFASFAEESSSHSVVKPESNSQVKPGTHLRTQDELKRSDPLLKRKNVCGIQMLPTYLHEKVFGKQKQKPVDPNVAQKIETHLKTHNLWGQPTSELPDDIDLKLPDLLCQNIAEHFAFIGEQQSKPYRTLLETFVNADLPSMPTKWNCAPGWTRYLEDGTFEIVNSPLEEVFVFDVEVCVKEGPLPTMATAVSPRAWYSWTSHQLTNTQPKHYRTGLDDLLPLESGTTRSNEAKLAIGHNVSFDRSKVREQYFIQGSKLRFLDTMSLHIAISGLTSYQRNMLMAGKTNGELIGGKNGNEILDWQQISSFNGLKDVHQLYCGGLPLEKDARNYFVRGTLEEIRAEFQDLMTYCAKDTLATYKVLVAMTPDFFQRFPHPVTFAGMLEMGTAYLPVNSNWERYLNDSEETYKEFEKELTHCLVQQANEACALLHQEKFWSDPWLWDLDWSVQDMKMKKTAPKLRSKEAKTTTDFSSEEDFEADKANLTQRFQPLVDTQEKLYKKKPSLPGYPAWYRMACEKENVNGSLASEKISTSMQIVPKLLRLTWDGYPLHYVRELGWGYLVPGRPLAFAKKDSTDIFPIEEAIRLFPPRERIPGSDGRTKGLISPEEALHNLGIMTGESADTSSLKRAWTAIRGDEKEIQAEKTKKKPEVTSDRPSWHEGIGPYDVGIKGAWFFRLPHKGGAQYNVGNPLAKDYQNKIEDGTLSSSSGAIAKYILKLSKMLSYWRNARDRIFSQMVVWLPANELPSHVTQQRDFSSHEKYGAIVPQVVIAGTLTRRAVEPTWMTASNAYSDRLGSELKAMVQAPPGYCLVGADVDSQELWIAAIIGDAHFAGEHGSTAFGWMTLQGKKSAGTDMHSRTASTVDINRDQAKVLNYGRIYGAGEKFAKTLLMQFNHRLSESEALEKAKHMYAATKGVSMLEATDAVNQLVRAAGEEPQAFISYADLTRIRGKVRQKARQGDWEAEQAISLTRLPTDQLTSRRLWVGGTESPMFNKLEEIAQQEEPVTPVLGCRISRALEPSYCGKEFMTSRINWVVQSSAVDYLHLMLVAMRYLFDTYEVSGRFCISIHDEVRYLVRHEDRYRAGLALQITNLWTRAMFAYQLGMNDLPQSVAFFSSVDIDTVLRKEVNMDCKTPSNPQGLSQGYGIPFGEALDIQELVKKTGGNLQHYD
nr:EOG090X00SQ [Triops cancriformis]